MLQDASESARLDTELLLGHAIQQSRAYLYTWPEKELSPTELNNFNQAFDRRLNGEPIAYIIEEKEFWSLPLKVNSSTLIPRPETELLIELALELLPDDQLQFQQQNTQRHSPQRQVLDLGTGTGAIALALAHERRKWKITAVDSSQAAVNLARENQKYLGINNVEIIKSNWFEALPGKVFDLIATNPPYIEVGDTHLSQGDVRFEPHSALVAKDNGLADIELIISQGRDHLLPGGWLITEHGYQQHEAVQQLFKAYNYTNIHTHHDLSNQPRATRGQLIENK